MAMWAARLMCGVVVAQASTQGGANPELFQAFMATPDAGQLNKAVSQFMKRTTTALDAGSSPAEIGVRALHVCAWLCVLC